MTGILSNLSNGIHLEEKRISAKRWELGAGWQGYVAAVTESLHAHWAFIRQTSCEHKSDAWCGSKHASPSRQQVIGWWESHEGEELGLHCKKNGKCFIFCHKALQWCEMANSGLATLPLRWVAGEFGLCTGCEVGLVDKVCPRGGVMAGIQSSAYLLRAAAFSDQADQSEQGFWLGCSLNCSVREHVMWLQPVLAAWLMVNNFSGLPSAWPPSGIILLLRTTYVLWTACAGFVGPGPHSPGLWGVHRRPLPCQNVWPEHPHMCHGTKGLLMQRPLVDISRRK